MNRSANEIYESCSREGWRHAMGVRAILIDRENKNIKVIMTDGQVATGSLEFQPVWGHEDQKDK